MSKISRCGDDTATAYQAWDLRWGSEQGRSDWMSPEKDVLELAGELKRREAKNVLDLGCGVGRHTVFLASQGLAVFAADASPNGLESTRMAVVEAGLPVDIRHSQMTNLPYPNGFFDYVLAWNVIYHGTPGIVKTSISEISRVLRPGGLFQGTLLAKRNTFFGRGHLIDVDTYVVDVDDEEKRHPHFYCNVEDILTLFAGFEILSLRLCEQKMPGSFHWNMVLEKNSLGSL